LGTKTPIVHTLLDSAVIRLGYKHRYLTHNKEFLDAIKTLLGKNAKRTAILHIMQDWGCIKRDDFNSVRKTTDDSPKVENDGRSVSHA